MKRLSPTNTTLNIQISSENFTARVTGSRPIKIVIECAPNPLFRKKNSSRPIVLHLRTSINFAPNFKNYSFAFIYFRVKLSCESSFVFMLILM